VSSASWRAIWSKSTNAEQYGTSSPTARFEKSPRPSQLQPRWHLPAGLFNF